MKILDDIKIGRKLIGSFLVVVLIMIIVGGVGYVGVTTTNSYLTQMYSEQLLPTHQLDTIAAELYQIRGNTPGYLAIKSDREKNRIQNDVVTKYIDDNLTSYEPYLASDKEREIYNELVKETTHLNASQLIEQCFYFIMNNFATCKSPS